MAQRRRLLASPEHASFDPDLRPFIRENGKHNLKLPNSIELTFGQTVAFAGDFYGVPEEPIIYSTKQDQDTKIFRRKRFLSAFGTLAHAEYSKVKRESDELIRIMQEETQKLEEAINEGKSMSEKDSIHFSMRYDTVLGGKWFLNKPVKFGRMMSLAANNFDHFMPFAREAYEIGHELALEKAREATGAAKENQEQILHEAYAIDAFACHFLTDSFASGHMRTPRLELHKHITPKKLGDYLSKFMHDEDGRFGLQVTNKRGDQWIAYGDGLFFHKGSEDNRKIASEAVEISTNQIFEAYSNPNRQIYTNRVTDLIPFINDSKKNNYPMFQMKDGDLVRRADLNNLADSNVTSFYGIATWSQLEVYSPSGSLIDTSVPRLPSFECNATRYFNLSE